MCIDPDTRTHQQALKVYHKHNTFGNLEYISMTQSDTKKRSKLLPL